MSASFCWSCGRALRLPHFAEYTDPIGQVHRVHKVCLERSPHLLKPVTASPMGEHCGHGVYQPNQKPTP